MKLGCIKSPTDLRNYRINRASITTLPAEHILEHTTILNQENVSSCVAHSMASIVESIYHKQFSVGWLYGNRNFDYLGVGMNMLDVLKTAQKKGCVPKEDFDLNEEMTSIYNIVNAKKDILTPLAEPYKIGAYARLEGIEDIKVALLKDIPVMACISVKEDNLSTKNGIINITDDKVKGGHAITIIGYNDTGFVIQNSWGSDWGNNGIAILPYEYQVEEAWAISPKVETEDIVKPKLYWLRKLITEIIKILKQVSGR